MDTPNTAGTEGQAPLTGTPPPSDPPTGQSAGQAAGGEPTPDDGDDDPRIKRANADAARYRTRLREVEAREAALAAKVKEFEQANLTEQERRDQAFKALQDKAGEFEGSLRDRESALQHARLENAVLKAAHRLANLTKDALPLTDADAALKLMDHAAIEFEDDGQPKAESVEKALRRLARDRPWLVATTPAAGSGSSPANPPRSQSGPPMTLEDFRGKSEEWINAHWPAYLQSLGRGTGT